MNALERKFLLAVERGDSGATKETLRQKTKFNINCCDPLTRNALIIAIDNENIEMVNLLIQAGIKTGDALLYAIDQNFVEAVEILLDHEESQAQKGRPYSWNQPHENSSFSSDMTPLIIAAHRNNYEIIKLLLDRKISPLQDPHDPTCECIACSQARNEDCLKYSRSRINAYKALASPCFMALSCSDPLLSAFELSAKLEGLARMEPEYKQDYFKIRAQCQTFATALLDHTRTSKELEILLNYSDEFINDQTSNSTFNEEMAFRNDNPNSAGTVILQEHYNLSQTLAATQAFDNGSNLSIIHEYKKEKPTRKACGISIYNESVQSVDSVTGKHESYRSHMRLARLRLAIQCKQKTFCAHPNVQEYLTTMWYENLPGFRRKRLAARYLQVIFIGLMFPVYSTAYLIAPHTQLGRYIKKPFIKFICHSASYITFLVVLMLASQRVEAFYDWNTIISLFSPSTQSNVANMAQREQVQKLKEIITASSSKHERSFDLSSFDADKLMPPIITLPMITSGDKSISTARGLESLVKIFEPLPASSKKRGALPSPIEIVILMWVLSLIWAEIKQIRALGMNYYKADMWNTLDSVASGFYIATIILRMISYIQSERLVDVPRENWDAYDPTLLSEGLFAAATIFSTLKLVYIFSLNPYLGPLQISLGRMIVDILRFSFLYILVLFSFACGMNQLLWYYADLEKHQCLNITNYSIEQYRAQVSEALRFKQSQQEFNDTEKIHLGEEILTNPLHSVGNTSIPIFRLEDASKPPVTIDDSCKTWRYFSNVFESLQTLFWATFGLVDLGNFDLSGIKEYTRFWALLMFGCYCFINVVVVLNMLIAMMNHSYVKISKKSDIEWKYARTKLWMSYFDTGSTVPPPFNIIPSIKSVINSIFWVYCSIHEALIWVVVQMKIILNSMKAHKSNDDKTTNTRRTGDAKNTNTFVDNITCIALKVSYRNVMRLLVRRYLVHEQQLLERKRGLTEAKLNRWAKLNAFD